MRKIKLISIKAFKVLKIEKQNKGNYNIFAHF